MSLLNRFEYWKEKIGINKDWTVYLIHEKDQSLMRRSHLSDYRLYQNANAVVQGDVMWVNRAKVSLIRLYKWDEKILVHELLHLKHKKAKEEWIEAETNRLLERE